MFVSIARTKRLITEPVTILSSVDHRAGVANVGINGYTLNMWNASWQAITRQFASQHVAHIRVSGTTTVRAQLSAGGIAKYFYGNFDQIVPIDKTISSFYFADATGRTYATVIPYTQKWG